MEELKNINTSESEDNIQKLTQKQKKTILRLTKYVCASVMKAIIKKLIGL